MDSRTTSSALSSIPPKLVVVGEELQVLVVAGRLDQPQHESERPMDRRRCMAHVEVERLEAALEMQLGVIAEPVAHIAPVAIGDGPADDVAEGQMVEMQI